MRHEQVNAIVVEVARYLSANIDASDTAEGIARWWFPVAPDRGSMMLALNWLKEHDFVERLQAADGHVRYRRNAGPASHGAAWLQVLVDSLSGDETSGGPH